MKKIGNILFKLKHLLFPSQVIAGLEIKDAALRFVQFQDDGSFKKESIPLEPGIIQDGRISDRGRFIKSLGQLRGQFTSVKEKIPVIALIPSANVYVKVFSLPPLTGEKVKEAAQLNLESISPIEFKNAYADWQPVGGQEKDGKVELLGAFAGKDVVDSYIQALEFAGFLPVAIEFSSLAIARLAKQYASVVNFDKPHVAVHLSSDGIDFMIFCSGNLYFDYFVPWKLIQEDSKSAREILFKDFNDTIVREIRKVVIFYGSRWGGRLDSLILITQALQPEITKLIKENFEFEVTELKLFGFPELDPVWFAAAGGAVRGRLPRSKDNFISLTALGTEDIYLQSEIIFFIKMWRNAVLTVLVFLFFMFVGMDSFLARTSNGLAGQLQSVLAVPGGAEVVKLREQAENFNQLVNKALIAKERSPSFIQIFSKIDALLSPGITLDRLSIIAGDFSVFLVGSARDEKAALDFKNRLLTAGYKGVNLPLSDLEAKLDGTVSFSLTFSL